MTTPSGRSPEPITVWNRLLRGYGPFLLLATLVLGMAVFVPSACPRRVGTTVATRQRAAPTSGRGRRDRGAGGGATDGRSRDFGTGGRGGGSAAPRAACSRAPTEPPDPERPVLARRASRSRRQRRRHDAGSRARDPHRHPPHPGRQLRRGAGRHRRRRLVDTPEDSSRTLDVLVEYFNEHFQFYGRKLVLDFYDGQGSIANELVGNGRDKAEVDATKVAEEIKPFADLTALSEPYGDALAATAGLASVRRCSRASGSPTVVPMRGVSCPTARPSSKRRPSSSSSG